MAALAQAFDPKSVEPQKAFEPIPRGDYDVMVVNTSIDETQGKTGKGKQLIVELEVQGGAYARRKVWDRITIENNNIQAMEIGQRQLSGLCHGVGYLQALTDSDVLHGRGCVARIGIEKGDGQYQDKNKVQAYIAPGDRQTAVASAPATAPVGTAASAPPAAQAAPKKKPWEK